MEYASGGELFNYLVHERRFSENKVGSLRLLMMNTSTAQSVCYNMQTAHCSLACHNPVFIQDPVILLCRRATSSSSWWQAWSTATPRCSAVIAQCAL